MMPSPLTISIMLDCYTGGRGLNIPEKIWESSAAEESRMWLLENGLIDRENKATERGNAWVEYICNVDLPVRVWKLPNEVFNGTG